MDKGEDSDEDLVSDTVSYRYCLLNKHCLASSSLSCPLGNCGGGRGLSIGAGPTGPAPLGSSGELGEVQGLGSRGS